MSIYNISGVALNSCYNVAGSSLNTAYNISGGVVFSSDVTTNYDDYTATFLRTISTQNTQGMEIYNGVLFQFRGSTADQTIDDHVCLYDFEAGTSIYNNMVIDSGHANAVVFGPTFYDPGDEFPIIYTGDWWDAIVHVNRITRSGATHLYDIVYSQASAGYHANPAFDFDNEIMYTVGYYQNSTSDSTNNHCIVCAWDISNMTDNGDGTFSPTLISTFTRPYIYVMQDLKFNDGYVWITSGLTGTNQYAYAMDPATGSFVHTITMPVTTEIEGLVWDWDDATNTYFAYVGIQGGIYYKVTFSAL